MDPNNSTLQSSIRYFHHEMAENEKNAFEKRMQSDPDFKLEVQQHLHSIQALGRQQIREKAANSFEQMEQKHLKKRKAYYQYAGIAASILICLGVLFRSYSPPDMSRIYAENYTFHKVGSRGVALSQNSTWNRALDLYEDESRQGFPQAISLFQTLLLDSAFQSTHSNEANLYLGISYLELKQSDSALLAFEKVDSKSLSYYGDAVWYAALAQLQKEDLKAARQVFRAIQSNARWPNARRERASEILKALGE